MASTNSFVVSGKASFARFGISSFVFLITITSMLISPVSSVLAQEANTLTPTTVNSPTAELASATPEVPTATSTEVPPSPTSQASASPTLAPPTAIETAPPTATPRYTESPTPTQLASSTETGTETPTIDPSATVTASQTETATETPTATATEQGFPYFPGDQIEVTGWAVVAHGDDFDGNATAPLLFLVTDEGQTFQLQAPSGLLDDFGGLEGLERANIAVRGIWTLWHDSDDPSQGYIEVEEIELAAGQRTQALSGPQSIAGTNPYINVMCRFSDYTGFSPKTTSFFNGLMSSSFPGLDHYWREVSYNQMNIAGSSSAGWFNLSKPLSYYMNAGNPNLTQMAIDCLNAGNSSVNFASYAGINLIFNQDIGCCAWGTSGFYASLDGVAQYWPLTWMPLWSHDYQSVFAHEMGHSFGLPHSSGPYGEVYDSSWDVMSNTYLCAVYHETYWCPASHTLAYYKYMLGWIPNNRVFVPSSTSTTTITLERLAQPPNADDTYLMARIPINGSSTNFYTVEARKLTGYDQNLPASAVIINRINLNWSEPAHIVDADGNGDPNDSGAQWIPGETFTDASANISVEIVSTTATTYTVTISLNYVPVVPSNDLRANALAITEVPYDLQLITTEATSSSDDPAFSMCGRGKGANSVWFSYQPPNNGVVAIDTYGSDYDTMAALWRLNSNGSLTGISCNDDAYSGNLASYVNGTVQAGNTYLIEVVEYAPSGVPQGDGPSKPLSSSGGGELVLSFDYSPFLTSPAILSPENLGYSTSLTPQLSWSEVQYADMYAVQISRKANLSQDASEFWLYTEDEFIDIEDGQLAEGKWYWRVYAFNNVITSVSSIASFTIDIVAPGIPVLDKPADGYLVRLPVGEGEWTSFLPHTWKAASGGATTYQVQFDREGEDFSTPELETATDKLTASVSFAPEDLGGWIWRVRAVDAAGNEGGWSVTRSEYVVEPLTIAPAVVVPTANQLINDNTPEFEWADVNWGDSYQLQIDNTKNFSSPEVDVYPTDSETGHTLVAALGEGTWYWRVRAWNGNTPAEGGAWTAAQTLRVDTTPPSAPALSAPAAGAVWNGLTPKFTWAAAATASQYRLQVSNDGFSTTVVDVTTSAPSYQLTAGQALDFVAYEWRVAAVDLAGNWSDFGEERSFTPSILSFPKHGAFLTDETPLLQWFAVPGAQTYAIQIDDDPAFGSPAVDALVNAPSLSSQLGDTAYGTWYWRMAVMTNTSAPAYSSWSSAYNFTITPPQLPAPTLVGPATKAQVNTNTPELSWTSNFVSGQSDGFEIQIDNNSNFSSPEEEFGVASPHDTSVLTPSLPDGQWYWRMRTRNVFGAVGGWSASRILIVDTTPPAAPVLSAPANAATSIGLPSAFTWTKPAGSSQFQLQFDPAGTFAPAAFSSTWQTAVSLKVTPAMYTPPSGTPINWRVCARDVAGNEACSAARALTVNYPKPAAPIPLSLAANAITNDATPELTWLAGAYGTEFELQVANNTKFTSPLSTPLGDPADTSFTLGSDLSDGVWYWRVRASNDGGLTFGPYSAARKFTVDTVAPAAPTLSKPIDNFTTTAAITFQWSPVAGAKTYEIEIDLAGNGFASPVYATSLNKTSVKAPVLPPGDYEWRVRVIDSAGNPSATWSQRAFEVQVLKPAVPALIAPAANAATNDDTPSFAWNSAVNADTYRLQISSAANFATLAVNEVTGTGELNLDLLSSLGEGAWYWRVAAVNSNGVQGNFSASRKLTIDITEPSAPALTAPAASQVVTGTPLFKWTKPAGVTQMKLEITEQADPTFAAVLYDSGWITASQSKPVPAAFDATGNLIWRVTARDAAGNESPVGEIRDIVINALIPSVAPALSGPANNGFTNDDTPELTWAKVPYGDHYEIQISTTNKFTTVLDGETGVVGDHNTSFTPGSLVEGKYYWRVRAYNELGAFSAKWSAVFAFTVDQSAPAAPVLSLPLDVAVLRNAQPAFKWALTAGASLYQVEVDEGGGDFSTPVYLSGWVKGSLHTPPTNTLALGDYIWRLQAQDAAGNLSATSVERGFSIVEPIPVAPVQTLPAANASLNDNTPTFAWNATAWADTYAIEVSTNNKFTTIAFSADSIADLNMIATTLPNGTYYWRVRAVNAAGELGAWSKARTVKIVP